MGRTHIVASGARNSGDFGISFAPSDPGGRLVYLTGEVSETSISIVQQQILALATDSNEPIHLVVSTYGGAVHEMFSLYDLMKFINPPVYTVALGKVMSAGSLILAAGEKGKRLIGRSTRVMIHSLSSGMMGNVFELINEVDEVKLLQNMYIERMVKETKMNEKQLRTMLGSKIDSLISAEEAVKLGLADIIIG